MANEISNTDAERNVIGSLLSDTRVQDQAARLTVADFRVESYRKAFAEIQRLKTANKAIDLTTVCERLGSNGAIMIDLIDAIQATPVTFNCSSYVDLVLNASMRRKASTISEMLYKAVGDPAQDAQEAITSARAKLSDIGIVSNDWMTAAEIGTKTLEDLERSTNCY